MGRKCLSPAAQLRNMIPDFGVETRSLAPALQNVIRLYRGIAMLVLFRSSSSMRIAVLHSKDYVNGHQMSASSMLCFDSFGPTPYTYPMISAEYTSTRLILGKLACCKCVGHIGVQVTVVLGYTKWGLDRLD